MLVHTVISPNTALGERWDLNQRDAQLVAQDFLLGIACRRFLVRGFVRIPVARVALVFKSHALFRAKAVELPREVGAIVFGEQHTSGRGKVVFEEVFQHLAAQRLADFPFMG